MSVDILEKRLEFMSDTLVRTLLALEEAYKYHESMPEYVRALIAQRIEEARESC